VVGGNYQIKKANAKVDICLDLKKILANQLAICFIGRLVYTLFLAKAESPSLILFRNEESSSPAKFSIPALLSPS